MRRDREVERTKRCRGGSTWPAVAVAGILCAVASTAHAQVAIHPRSAKPAAWERFALRVVNGTDTATTGVRVDVPDAVTILGIDSIAGWTTRSGLGTDSAPQFVEWSGGKLHRGQFLEFSFLGRVVGDARRTELVFPVTITRESGTVLPPQRLLVTVVGRTQLSVRGVTAIAGTALGVALIALIVAIARGQRSG